MIDKQVQADIQQSDHIALAIKFMEQQGIKYDVVTTETPQPDGSVKTSRALRILQIPDAYMAITRFFSDPDAPCNFPGCTAFQAEFKKKIQAAGGSSCPACDRGRIIREMTPRVQAAMGIRLDKHESIVIQSPQNNEPSKETNSANDNTGSISLSGSGSESSSGTTRRPSLLRRAATCIKKVFRIGT